MKTQLKRVKVRRSAKRQGRLLAFGMTGAMALAVASCSPSDSGPVMIAPPNNFNTGQAYYYNNTNQAPNAPYLYAGNGTGGYLGAHGYYPMFGYPGYYYRPAPGSTVRLVTGGPEASSYRAGSASEANESVARGGFGRGGGGGGGEGGGE